MTGRLERPDGDYLPRDEGSGSYAFDEATLRSLITDWHALADSYDTSLANANDMAQVEGPGLDFASQLYAAKAAKSGKSYAEYLQKNRDHCREQAELFQKALDTYLNAEDAAKSGLNAAGGPEQ